MRNASVPEWILGRFTSHERAASVVGDLEELKQEKGAVWFWFSFSGILLALCWRRVAAWIAVLFIGSRVFEAFSLAITRPNSQHRPADTWVVIGLTVFAVDVFLWMTFFYAVIRYGVRDRAAQLAFLWAGLVVATLVCWHHHTILSFCIALCAYLALSSAAKMEDRKAMLIVIATVAAGSASYLLASYVASLYQHVVSSGPLQSRGLQEHPSIGLVAFFLLLMATWSTIAACSCMHAWIDPHMRANSEI